MSADTRAAALDISKALTEFGMLVFFTNNKSLMEFHVRYLALFLLFSVIDDFEWFWIAILHRNIQLMLEFLMAPFLVLNFSFYTLTTFLMMLSVILLSMLILRSISRVIRDLICGNNLASELQSDLQDTVDWGKKWLVDFIAGKTQLASFDWSDNTSYIDVKMDGSVPTEKSSWGWLMLGLTFSSKLDWGSYIISIAKTASKKIGALIPSMKFLSPEIALYLNESTICPCMKYCCHVWAGTPSCCLELLQKRICRTLGPSLAASLEPLGHYWNVASLSLFYRYYFGRCSSELTELVPIPFFSREFYFLF